MGLKHLKVIIHSFLLEIMVAWTIMRETESVRRNWVQDVF